MSKFSYLLLILSVASILGVGETPPSPHIESKWIDVRSEGPQIGSVDPVTGDVTCGWFGGRMGGGCKKLARQIYRALLTDDQALQMCRTELEKTKTK